MSHWPQHWRRFFPGRNAASRGQRLYRPVLECLEERCLLSDGYAQVNLASDTPGLARVVDPNLVNPWGISFSPTGPFWFANNGSGLSDLLDGRGHAVPLVVTVPSALQSGATPTGTVFNSGPGFTVSENGVAAPSRFLFATEDGTISGWSAVVDRTRALLASDNSSAGALYKGLTLAADSAGRSFLYAADFGRGTIDVFDQDFKPVARPGSFHDPNLPSGFAPFNIQNINSLLYVTYAQHDVARRDDVAGAGHGFINIYDIGGNFIRRFASQGTLNSPWGLALAPADFGSFGGALLVGNNGDGHINAYEPGSGAFLGLLADGNGTPITVPHLWALMFGNGHAGGASDNLFFTAGVDDEKHGLFGAIQSLQRKGMDTAGSGAFDPHAPGEPEDYPLPPSGGPAFEDGDDNSRADAVLLPMTESSLVLIPTLSTVVQAMTRIETAAHVADSFRGSVGMALGVSSMPLFLPPVADSSLPKDIRNNSLALNAFLDLNVPQTLPEDPVWGQQSDSQRDSLGDRHWLAVSIDVGAQSLLAESDIVNPEASSSADQAPKSLRPSGQADNVLVQVSSEARGRQCWTELLSSLLVAISIPVICVLCGGRRAGHLAGPRRRFRAKAEALASSGFESAFCKFVHVLAWFRAA
jgi:uncharacterized protein (TIGR03118 family)